LNRQSEDTGSAVRTELVYISNSNFKCNLRRRIDERNKTAHIIIVQLAIVFKKLFSHKTGIETKQIIKFNTIKQKEMEETGEFIWRVRGVPGALKLVRLRKRQ